MADLEKKVTAVDTEYDKCNMVMAHGELNGFNEKFLSLILNDT